MGGVIGSDDLPDGGTFGGLLSQVRLLTEGVGLGVSAGMMIGGGSIDLIQRKKVWEQRSGRTIAQVSHVLVRIGDGSDWRINSRHDN